MVTLLYEITYDAILMWFMIASSYTNNCIIIFSIGTDYFKLEKKRCYPSTPKKPFLTFEQAKSVCSSDSGCQGIYDDDCDQKSFKLCHTSSTIKDAFRGDNDCIYQKPKGTVLYFIYCMYLDNHNFSIYILVS